MLDTFDKNRLQQMQPDDISDSLEGGSIVFFPESPVQIPSAEDLAFIRQELPDLLRLKNVSYHPEAGRIRGLDKANPELAERVKRILLDVSDNIADFLTKNAPRLVDNWTVGTCSFRPIEEQGRKLGRNLQFQTHRRTGKKTGRARQQRVSAYRRRRLWSYQRRPDSQVFYQRQSNGR